MKKYLLAITFLALPFVLSGCATSSSPQNPASSFYKSTDGGKTWTVQNKTSETGLDLSAIDVISMVVNPNDGNNVFAGTKSRGIIKTEDGGETWVSDNFSYGKVYGIAINPIDGRIIYATGAINGRGKIWKTINSGKDWQEIYTTPANGPLVISLVIDNKNPNILYASTSDNQVIKTTDGGQTWKNIFQNGYPVLAIAFDAQNDNQIYFADTGNNLYISKNGGTTMTNITQKLQTAHFSGTVSEIVTDPTIANTLYAIGTAGILKSVNAGNTWSKFDLLNDPQNFPVQTLIVNPMNSQEIIYGAAQAAYKSIDGGKTWTTAQFNTSKTVNVLKYDPANSNNVYLGLDKI